ncbi:MAG: cupredoxin domain-containing protein [Nitrospirota bacterium]
MAGRMSPWLRGTVSIALMMLASGVGFAGDQPERRTAQEQRIDLTIRNYEFLLTQPAPVRHGIPTVIILRNQDIVRHGFTAPVLAQLALHVEGEGIAAYGRGMEGVYVDPGKTLVIRFTPDRAGNYSFRCDLHPGMKGELYLLEIPAA